MKLKVHPAISHAREILESVPEQTGKSVEDWAVLLVDAGVKTQKEITKYLRDTHNIARPTAAVLFSKINDIRRDFEDDAYLEGAPEKISKQFSGGKARLRAVADKIFAVIDGLGDDVGASPTKSNVPFYRKHVFAQVEAATQNSIDVGLALGGYSGAIPEGLFDTEGVKPGDRITHVFKVKTLADVDDDLRSWLKMAYELDA